MDIIIELKLNEALKKAEFVTKIYYNNGFVETKTYNDPKSKGELVFVKCLDGCFFCKKFIF